MTRFSDLGIMDREPAFPIYASWSYSLDAFPADYEPGRIINPTEYREPGTGRIDRRIEEHIGPNDIIFVPLFLGDENPEDVYSSMNIHSRLPGYDENLALISAIAPRVRAIIIGNAGCELSFKQQWIEMLNSTMTMVPRRWMSDAMCNFMRYTAGIVINAGGTPAYCPVDWDVAIDCYYGESRYRDLSNELGAIQYCCCGYQLFGLQRREGYPKVPDPSDPFFWPTCPTAEDPPWPILSEYLRGYDLIISGVGHLPGLIKGNDAVLASHGFDAGACAGLINNA